MTVPDDWNIVITDNADGTMEIGFVNDEVPDDYLDLVSGGITNIADVNSGCTDGTPSVVNPWNAGH